MSNLVDRVELRKSFATFTSRKMDALDALAADIRLKPVDKLIGLVIIQHVNRGTRKALPSIQRIGERAGGISEPTVKRAIKNLCNTGWLRRRRAPKKGGAGFGANIYTVPRLENLRVISSFTFPSSDSPLDQVLPSKVLRDHRRSQLATDFDPSCDDNGFDDYSDEVAA
jgi:predicted transcriptional regulator